MGNTGHSQHRFSSTIHTDDLAIVGCLRALAKFSQKTGNNNIPWGGTKDQDWRRDHHTATFHFSSVEYRDGFVAELNRLLLNGFWSILTMSDNDPARPQN